MTDTKTQVIRPRVIIEETIYGRKEPWLTMARKAPKAFEFMMKSKRLERWTRGPLKGHYVTESEV